MNRRHLDYAIYVNHYLHQFELNHLQTLLRLNISYPVSPSGYIETLPKPLKSGNVTPF